MSDLVFIAFDSEQKAEEARERALGLQKKSLIELDDAVVAVRDAEGRVKLDRVVQPAAGGAVPGAIGGMMLGWLFMMPIAGAAVGAAGGALGGPVGVGVNDDDMRRQADEALKPGGAGLFLLIRKVTTAKALDDLDGVGGAVIRTSFNHATEEALKAALATRVPAAPVAAESAPAETPKA